MEGWGPEPRSPYYASSMALFILTLHPPPPPRSRIPTLPSVSVVNVYVLLYLQLMRMLMVLFFFFSWVMTQVPMWELVLLLKEAKGLFEHEPNFSPTKHHCHKLTTLAVLPATSRQVD